MRCAIVGYVPRIDVPAKVCAPAAFVQNLRKFKTTAPLILFSDGKYPEIPDLITIPNPELYIDPNAKLRNGWPNHFALNNLIFFTGLRIAHRQKLTHMLYIEADCRFGKDHWDDVLFDFHFKHREPLVASGTAVMFNPCSDSRAALRRWKQWDREQVPAPGFDIPAFGWGGQSYTTEKPTVFVNGALGVYDLHWLYKFFPDALKDDAPARQTPVSESESWASRLSSTGHVGSKGSSVLLAESSFAWDFAIGYELWKRMGIHAFSCVQNNPHIYSGYGDTLSTETERLEMLRKGEIVATHQVKSSATL